MTPLGLLLPSMVSFCGFFFPTSKKPAMEYLSLVKTLALGRPYALGTLLLASVYQAMSKYVSDEPYRHISGAL